MKLLTGLIFVIGLLVASEAAPKRQLNYKVRGGKQEVTKGEVPSEVVNGTVTATPVGGAKPEKGVEKETGVQSPAGVVQPPAVSPLPPTVVTPGGAPATNATKGEGDEDESSEEEEEDEDEEGDDDIEERKRGSFDPSYKHMNFFIPGYVTSEGEVLVPIDTITKDYSIVSDPIRDFRRNPYAQRNKVSRNEIRNVVPVPVPESQEVDSASSEEEPLKVQVFKPKEKETVKIVPVEKKPEVESVEVQSFEQEAEEGSSEEGEKIVKIEGEKKVFRPPPLALVPATKPTDEDDEEELRSRWLWRNRYRFYH